MKFLHGEPPPEVLSWREVVLGHFCGRVDAGPHVKAAEIKRLHVWRYCFTGDGRKDAPEHYHVPGCLQDDDLCRAYCVESVDMLTCPAVELYSRRSFHGHLRCVEHIILLMATGVLRPTCSCIMQKAEEMASAARAQLQRAPP